MEEVKGSKTEQAAYSSEPSMAVLIDFFCRYMAHLLPALLKIGTVRSCHGHQCKEIEKTVRFEVDMALVVSASGFAWSRALRRKLEQGMNVVKRTHHHSPSKQLPIYCNLSSSFVKETASGLAKALDELLTVPLYARPLAPFSSQMNKKPDDRQLGIYNTVKPKRLRWNVTRDAGRGDEELYYRVRTLRRILPGGNEMGVSELLSEVESYVVCLELQVSVLRILLGAH